MEQKLKYNWSIIGHESALLRVEQDVSSGNIFHAYLLAGPNSVGKFTVAKKLAGILQCEQDFCHECKTCLQIEKGSHIDTVEMIDDGESIKIEEMRDLIQRANLTRQSRYKVFIIQSIERMTTEAANSFLKILEEPPAFTVFILTTNNLAEILPTIVSRVRAIKFNNVSAGFLTQKMKELYPLVDDETVHKVSLFSLGQTGRAINLMENPDALAKHVAVYHLVQNFLQSKSIYDRFSFVDDLLREEHDLRLFLGILTNVVRTKLLEGDGDEAEAHAASYLELLAEIEKANMWLKTNVNDRLILENLMLKICGPIS